MDRFELERAVLRSALPANSKVVLAALLVRVNSQTGAIPDYHQPSIRELALSTGLHRATVKRHLAALETAGWLIRKRPPLWAARKLHTTTSYTVRYPQAWRTVASQGARRTAMDPVGAAVSQASMAQRCATETNRDKKQPGGRSTAGPERPSTAGLMAELERIRREAAGARKPREDNGGNNGTSDHV